MYYVYIIQNCDTFEKYIGYTSNLTRRMKEHNDNVGKYTSSRSGKWILIYVEGFRGKNDALNREKKLKHHARGLQEVYKRCKNSFL